MEAQDTAEYEKIVNEAPSPFKLGQMVRKAVINNPENFEMDTWVEGGVNSSLQVQTEKEVHECGATLCIAGWATFLAGFPMAYNYDYEEWGFILPSAIGHPSVDNFVDPADVAEDLLGLRTGQFDTDECQYDDVFYSRPDEAIRWLYENFGPNATDPNADQ